MTFSLYGQTDFAVQYWNGSAWVDVPGGSVTGNNKVWRKFTFSAITTTKIRVLINNALFYNSRIVELEAWGTPAPTPQSFVTGKTLGALRNDYTGHVGMKITTNAEPLTITSLGRIYVNGNSGTHTLKVVRSSDNTVVASVDVSMNGGSSGQFKYAALPTPVVLAANTDYYVVSMETSGADQWYDYAQTVLTTTSVASVKWGTYSGDGVSWGPAGGAGNCYVPVDFLYTIGGTPPRTNVALASNGGIASASSTANASYPATAANNGDRQGVNWGNGGGWNDGTASAYPDWLQIDFNGSKSIDEVDVFTLTDGANFGNPVEPTEAMTFSSYGIVDFEVQYWNGSGWVTVPGGSVTANDKVWRKFTFSTITTSKVRVQISNALFYHSRIVELEAWGN